MAWEHLSINKPHLVYIILGGFTSIFMLCSSIIKERLYIGEATVATICGIVFGPHAANLINPDSWGNVDQITLEFSRIVLVVQCFAVGVELPKAYMEKHWRSVVFLLVPVMTFGWLITSLFIWAVFNDRMDWLDCLVCAACVTATDPVLASSVVGKGKFAKRVPRHLRDLLSAESGCNDGMAFPFIYLGIYLVRYRPDANAVALHWFCFTILYECIFGAVYGVVVGYLARRAIRFAHERDLIDRESFLVFYFVLALFCAGSGSLLGTDDLLVGFACGVGFSNDGWFQEKTEESHVSNVIDLLINLAFFVYFGTIIPWDHYSTAVLGMTPWKLVVVALLVLFFRRIPIMLMLKPVIPDIKTWREALFAGHFGPIGVGALFVAILARAEFETETTTPLAKLPEPGFEHRNIIELIWPITTFLVITSIIVHGSSVAVFTLGRHINTLSFTMSYTKGNEDNSWMDRLPRIQSRSKSSMSLQKPGDDSPDDLEKYSPGPFAIPRAFLRRQKEEDRPSRTPSLRAPKARKDWDAGIGPGGHIEQSAVGRQATWKSQSPTESSAEKVDSDTTAVSSDDSPVNEEPQYRQPSSDRNKRPHAEVFQEGDNAVVEDEDGNVLEVVKSPEPETQEEAREREDDLRKEVSRLAKDKDVDRSDARNERVERAQTSKQRTQNEEDEVKDAVQGLSSTMRRKLSTWREAIIPVASSQSTQPEADAPSQSNSQRRQGPAHAFKIGNTVIVEDEHGEVIKKYDLPQRPRGERRPSYVDPERNRQRIQRVSKWIGIPSQEVKEGEEDSEAPSGRRKSAVAADDDDDNNIRFTEAGSSRRMSKADFLKRIQALDPHSRAEVVEESDAPEGVKRKARTDLAEYTSRLGQAGQQPVPTSGELTDQAAEEGDPDMLQRVGSAQPETPGYEPLRKLDSATGQDIPVHSVFQDVRRHSAHPGQETPAERRRRLASQSTSQPLPVPEQDSDDDGTEREPPQRRQSRSNETRVRSSDEQEETAAEKRRREGALGVSKEDSDEETEEPRARRSSKTAASSDKDRAAAASSSQSVGARFTGIRFADSTSSTPSRPRFGNIRWESNKGK